VVTFLFTDVEGSTRRWEADADVMRAALAAHDEVLRKCSAIREQRGGCVRRVAGRAATGLTLGCSTLISGIRAEIVHLPPQVACFARPSRKLSASVAAPEVCGTSRSMRVPD
jgi:class 3 adenylate cyclase